MANIDADTLRKENIEEGILLKSERAILDRMSLHRYEKDLGWNVRREFVRIVNQTREHKRRMGREFCTRRIVLP